MGAFCYLQEAKLEDSVICTRRHESIQLYTGGDRRAFSYLQKATWEHSVIYRRRHDMRAFSYLCIQCFVPYSHRIHLESAVRNDRSRWMRSRSDNKDIQTNVILESLTTDFTQLVPPWILIASIPAKTTHWHYACLTLGHRLGRWHNIKPAHGQCVVLAIMRPSESASAILTGQRSRWVRTLDSLAWHSVISLDSPYTPCFFNHQDGDNWWP